jgi:dihydroxyacetone kinase
MVSTAERAAGEMAVDDGEIPVEGTTLPADEAELGVTFGGALGAQAETIRKIPQIASSPR